MKQKSLKSIQDLVASKLISDEEQEDLQEVSQKFGVLIPPTISSLIASGQSIPIKRQFLPDIAELHQSSQELDDPIGDRYHEKVTGIVHRYPDRCLLKIVSVCPVYCRFCFRKEMIGPGKQSLSAKELEAALDYIRETKDIWEVILTGGDPLILKPQKLKAVIDKLSEIEHVKVIRIHTRVPVVDPKRITPELIESLETKKTVFIVLHANHADEFTSMANKACESLNNAGIPMLSQSVLLKGVNDDVATLSQLMRTFVQLRIKPYYLHHLDYARGTDHFRVTIEKGQALMRELQGTLSGLCLPTYMLEIPGGAGKMPIGPCYAHQGEGGSWLIEDYLGNLHDYV